MKNVPLVQFLDLGEIDFLEGWAIQQKFQKELVDRKISLKRHPEIPQDSCNHRLIFCQHPPVYTLGRSGDIKNLLLTESELQDRNAVFHHINRGGDITFHGPGQLVCYPIFDLDEFFTDVHKYVRALEEVVIRTLKEFDIHAGRVDGRTGVWLGKGEATRKICAIGVHMSRWVTLHGLAFNINTDLNYFKHIIPCGISDAAVTSLKNERKKEVDLVKIKNSMKQHFSNCFGFEYKT